MPGCLGVARPEVSQPPYGGTSAQMAQSQIDRVAQLEKEMAGLWKALDDDEKAEWNEKAKPKEESEEESEE